MTKPEPAHDQPDQAQQSVPSPGRTSPMPNDPRQLAGTARSEFILLSLISLAALAFAWPVLKLIVRVYEDNPDYSHGYLIPLLPDEFHNLERVFDSAVPEFQD